MLTTSALVPYSHLHKPNHHRGTPNPPSLQIVGDGDDDLDDGGVRRSSR